MPSMILMLFTQSRMECRHSIPHESGKAHRSVLTPMLTTPHILIGAVQGCMILPDHHRSPLIVILSDGNSHSDGAALSHAHTRTHTTSGAPVVEPQGRPRLFDLHEYATGRGQARYTPKGQHKHTSVAGKASQVSSLHPGVDGEGDT